MGTPTVSMVDMVGMVLAMLDPIMGMVLDIMVMTSVRLSLRLMLTPTFCTEDTMDMVLDMDTLVLDTMVLDTEFMESALLMPSQKLTLPSVWRICWTLWICRTLWIPLCWICLPWISPPDIKMDSQPSLFSLSVTTFSVLDIILGDG